MRPSLVGVVGDDEHARWLLGRFRADGVDTGGVRAMRQYADGRVASTGTAVQVVMGTLRSGDKVRPETECWSQSQSCRAENKVVGPKDYYQTERILPNGEAENKIVGLTTKL